MTIARLDICFTIQVLSQFMQSPKESHMEATLRMVRYIKGSPGLGILLSNGQTNTLKVYCDSDRAACPNTKRSIIGYVVKLGDSLLSWKSKKQQTVRRSSAEAKYRSMAAAVAEAIWMTGLLKELGNNVEKSVHLHCDSKAFRAHNCQSNLS